MCVCVRACLYSTLIIWHENRNISAPNYISPIACVALPSFSTLGTARWWVKILNIKFCFDFPYKFVRRVYHSKKNWTKYYHQGTDEFILSTRYSSQTLMTLELLYWYSKNSQVSNFMKMCSMGAVLFHADRDGRTDKYDAANSRFSQFFEHT
jgi:hypothetical protein